MFRVLVYELHGSVELWQKTIKLNQTFLSATKENGESFPREHEDDIRIIKELNDRNLQIYILMTTVICLLKLLVDPR